MRCEKSALFPKSSQLDTYVCNSCSKVFLNKWTLDLGVSNPEYRKSRSRVA